MFLPDVNVLVFAHRKESDRHDEHRAWLEDVLNDDRSFAISELVLSAVVRIATNRKIFREPTPIRYALAFANEIRTSDNCVIVRPGGRHWSIFNDLCERAEARGNLVADAYHAALAIESGCEWVTADRDYARFPGLRWRHPLDP